MGRLISAIVAMAENRVIGLDNQLPWHLPADLKHFKQVTSGHTVLMGRKTFESIGKPLPNRRTVMLTRNPDFKAEGGEVVHDVETALSLDDLFIIGGANVYELFWPHIQRLYLTLVHGDVEGDAHFPALDLKAWRLVSQENHSADDKNAFDYRFSLLERV